MTELVSAADWGVWAPKAQIHCEFPGTWNLEKLHLELKYFGRNDAEARLQANTDMEAWFVRYGYRIRAGLLGVLFF